ncbi:ribosome production factor 1 [Plasmodium brasilianum]|uniref:Ribosome production factor 1, putative n=2 Tax=Plasmodium (Plasmodium) TaxID=418103 RepID=A0A1A8VTV5_PLAMA|nr:ribosome production factor 1, putative [Plasmodium malariae]KAI4839451.1 ribosome production factor 1 [Plasmodium brasilianum]SBS83907.1 ribosome production factor 1, putative (RPF1) [Plasmodium malariae]SBT87871.1 ribosome production factor 1, putative [Plasmodium malariae]
MTKEKRLSIKEIENIDIDKFNELSRFTKNKHRKNALKGKAYIKKLVLRRQKKDEIKCKQALNIPVEKKIPRSIEKLAIFDESKLNAENEKFLLDETFIDEFSDYFKQNKEPNIVITSIKRPSKNTILFMKELSLVFPHIFYEPRLKHSIEFLIKNSIENKFSTFILIEEGINKHPKYMFICTLPNGPTAKYNLTNLVYAHKKKKTDIEITTLPPEVYITNFNTFIGQRIKRQLHTLVPRNPKYKGQKIVVFYNQRDFIFFRHFKYNFLNKRKCSLNEIGPGFTLQLLSLKDGLINDKEKMYEFVLRPDMKVNRKRMYL